MIHVLVINNWAGGRETEHDFPDVFNIGLLVDHLTNPVRTMINPYRGIPDNTNALSPKHSVYRVRRFVMQINGKKRRHIFGSIAFPLSENFNLQCGDAISITPSRTLGD